MREELEALEANINKQLKTLYCFNPEDVERGGVLSNVPCTRKELLLLLDLIKEAKEDKEKGKIVEMIIEKCIRDESEPAYSNAAQEEAMDIRKYAERLLEQFEGND